MSKLVDKERLARLAAGLDARMKAAVKKEEDRAKGIEEGLQGQIDAITNGDNGVLAQAKKYADDQDAAQKLILDAEDKRLDQAIKDEAASARAAEEALDGRVDTLEAFKNAHSHAQMEADIDALEAKDLVHEGRMDDIEDAADALDERVVAVENQFKGENSVDNKIAKAQAAAQKHADDAITALVDSAPEAMNTLNELAKAISDNKDVYDAYVEEHATAMATMKSDLQKEIDADVLVEKNRAEGKEAELLQAINNEASRADGVEKALDGRIAKNEAFVAAQPAKDEAQNNRLTALEAKFEGENSVANQIKAVADALDAHEEEAETKNGLQDAAIQQAQADANKANTAIGDANSGLVKEIADLKAADVALDGRIDVLETFKEGHSHAAMEQGIADNKAAIEKEVTDRNAAIAKALEDYTTSDDMMAILGNVVNSLALSMEDNKMVLKLGGVDGVEIHSTSLDMATEADIDAIIAALDAE